MPKVCFKTFGCKVNQYETQGIREDLLKEGYREVEEGADLYLINTCTVTEEADREARRLIRTLQKKNPSARIVVTGCYAQKDEKEILALGGVTHIVKQHEKDRIPDILGEKTTASTSPYISPPLTKRPAWLSLQLSDFKGHTRAFIKVQDGCDYRCAFCKVWVVRGSSVSRPLSEIIREAERLARNGFREVVLTGVSIGLYGRDLKEKADLLDVAKALESVPGAERVRLSSIDPIDVDGRFLERLVKTERVCHQLHLSLQSGDDAVLSRMQRNYTVAHYRSIVQKARSLDPRFSITTDVIVGFPGETETEFENTVSLIRELQLTRTHLFPYSHRKGTVAFRFQDLIPAPVIRSRMKRITPVVREASLEYRKPLLGEVVNVLAEEREPDGLLAGYTDHYVRVHFRGEQKDLGRILPVRVEAVTLDRTLGKALHEDAGQTLRSP